MLNTQKGKLLLLGLLVSIVINLNYYWEDLWTLWALHYLKGQDIVVSLTTTPHRIKELQPILDSLLEQNIRFRQIYVSIPHIFKRDNLEYQIPEWLEVHPRVTILRTEDFGPATKILGAVKYADLHDDTIIIAVDDDNFYPQNLVLRLAVRAKQNPNAAIGVSGAVLDFVKNPQGGIVKIMRDKTNVPILEGFGGIAYRAKFFDDSIYEISNAPDYCYNSDDLFISFHLAARKVMCQTLNNRFLKTYDIHQQQFGYQADALYNMGASQADRYRRCLVFLNNKYPEVKFNGNGIG